MKLNLGAADRHIDHFLCIDIAPCPCPECDAAMALNGHADTIAERTVDLSDMWPWPNSSVEEIMALDVIEHVGDGYRLLKTFDADYDVTGRNIRNVLVDVELIPFKGRVHFFSELHRVLVPGGRVTIETPDAAVGAGFQQDPTHCSPWTRNSFQYFGAGPGGDFARGRLSKAYGITANFRMVSMSSRTYQDAYDPVVKLTVVLEAVKP